MRGTFSRIFQAASPLDTESFRHLCEEANAAADSRLLHEFLLALNRELGARLGAPDHGDHRWAARLVAALVATAPEPTLAALASLLDGAALRAHDPLLAVVFEAVTDAPRLLDLVSDFVDTEGRLLQFRVRALEALVTKSPGEVDGGMVGLDAQPALRFLNDVVGELARGPATALGESCARWAAGFANLSRLFREREDPQVLEWLADVLRRLASAPGAPETLRVLLRILRANTPVPAWHLAAPRDGGDVPADGVGALIVDKALMVVLSVAAASWGRATAAHEPLPGTLLWPFHERVLEAALLDTAQLPRARAAAAGLLQLLKQVSPSVEVSPRAELYAELLLAPSRPDAPAAWTPSDRAAAEDRLDALADAWSDPCEAIRQAALAAGHAVAVAVPAGFQPRHYTKLLPLLSDEDPGVRALTMRTFQALAAFRSRKLAAVVDGIRARLRDETTVEEDQARGDLETALGITMDRLVEGVEQLERELYALEARRRELLQYMETEAVRVGEEIHHEVLNTLTAQLATAIDEEDQREAQRGLDRLVAELRRIMNNLYPRDLETQGFLQTIDNRLGDARRLLARRGQEVTVRLDVGSGVTDELIEACVGDRSRLVLLYRIVLEAINNARKHSHGSLIAVSAARQADGGVEIAIADDGAAGGGPFGEHTGMALMRRRAEEIGAAIEYGTGEGRGTAVHVRLAAPGSATGGLAAGAESGAAANRSAGRA